MGAAWSRLPYRRKGIHEKLPAGFQKSSRYMMTSGDLAPVSDYAGGGHSPFAKQL